MIFQLIKICGFFIQKYLNRFIPETGYLCYKWKMRNSNTRERSSQNKTFLMDHRTMKTANHLRQPVKAYKSHPSSGKKILSKLVREPVKKNDYNIDENMTMSRISEAQRGLQLLKKKMVARGMSQGKKESRQVSLEKLSQVNKILKKDIENCNANLKVEFPPLVSSKKNVQNKKASNNLLKLSHKQIIAHKKQQQVKIQRIIQNTGNPSLQPPISQKKDFNSLLQEELTKKGIVAQEDIEGELSKCSQGCGRMFNPNIIKKHQNICQKVFLSKRKTFDSASYRTPQIEGLNKVSLVSENKAQVVKKITKSAANQPKMPKWKTESLALRAGIKLGKGEQLSKQQKQAMKSGSDVQCKFCGRKFNETAAKRHLPFCEEKSKQIPRRKK